MSIFFGNLFWGVLLILIGASIIMRGFNINFPVVKIFIAIIIILFGLKILFSGYSSKSSRHRGIHSYSETGNTKDYTVVFASDVIDLRDITKDSKDIEISAVFGSALVYLPPDIGVSIETTSVFGACILPDKSNVSIISNERTERFGKSDSKVRIEATAVFGRLEFRIDETETKVKEAEPEPLDPDQNQF